MCSRAQQRSFSGIWQKLADDCHIKAAKARAYAKRYYDQHAHPLRKIGTSVRVQNTVMKRWTHVGTIVGISRNRDCLVKLQSGRIWWRNRRFLREIITSFQEPDFEMRESQATFGQAANRNVKSDFLPLPRRGGRITTSPYMTQRRLEILHHILFCSLQRGEMMDNGPVTSGKSHLVCALFRSLLFSSGLYVTAAKHRPCAIGKGLSFAQIASFSLLQLFLILRTSFIV